MVPKQIDCFETILNYWKLLAIWPSEKFTRYFKYYSKIFVVFFVVTYDILLTINFYYLPRQLDVFIEEMIFFFTEIAILCKALSVLLMRDKIEDLLDLLERDIFQPDIDEDIKIVQTSKKFVRKYWKFEAFISYTSNLTHVLTPLILHLFRSVKLELPVCSYYFIPDNIKETFIYPLYLYQTFGMHFHMLYNVNVNGFILGCMVLTIAQLKVLDNKLRRITGYGKTRPTTQNVADREYVSQLELNKCIVHFDEIVKFCCLVENAFSVTLFVQFCMSSCIICICIFRFTLPAPSAYYIFLTTYMTVMVFQVYVVCWFGSRIMEASSMLSVAIYKCDWIEQPRQFKSNLRLFVERMNKPLSITGCKMFPVSLSTFTSIINSAYSFFTLLRHMQSKEN